MNDKLTRKNNTPKNHSVLIANLSILWILLLYTLFIGSDRLDNIDYDNNLEQPVSAFIFLLVNFSPFMIGALGISYALFRHKLTKNGTFNILYIIGGIIFALALFVLLTILINPLAYLLQ